MRLRLQAYCANLHSPLAFSKFLNKNWHNPIALFLMPKPFQPSILREVYPAIKEFKHMSGNKLQKMIENFGSKFR
ncbi:hypothetical protein DYD21_08825 [Rhodohalobacter sp. SW132]|nr:hypothetical protein DYD21_08825 [Rhodohalobacter sp. SW132]